MEITAATAAVARTGPDEWFSGRTWMEQLGAIGTEAATRILRVTFEPRARTAWHRHPKGQVLHILSGTAWVQSEQGPVRELGPGDSVAFAPGERHWHGASPRCPMSHLAVQVNDPSVGEETLWEGKVSDDEYEAGLAERADP